MPVRPSLFLTALAALPLSFGCSCDEDRLSDGKSELFAEPKNVDFGRVFLGAEVYQEIELTVEGDLGVAYQLSFEQDPVGFFAGPAVAQVAPGATSIVEVGFRPAKAGKYSTGLVVMNDATVKSPIRIGLTAEAVPAPDCEDGNLCTTDTFDPNLGRCEHEAADHGCDDLNYCTIEDTCVSGVCLGRSKNCDDDNPCTEDLCDPTQGCVNRLIAVCNDQNPCTADTCDPVDGCVSTDLPEGTPCDDGEPCTMADICVLGHCVGVVIPDGEECDDRDPCSKNDQCIDGVCEDPNYRKPDIGQVRFSTPVAALTPGAASNPIIDRDGTTYVGVDGGIVAVDLCGEIRWEDRTLGTPAWEAAVSAPGRISVPVGGRILDVRSSSMSGSLESAVGLRDAFDLGATTATITVTDVAMRSSRALVAGVTVETADGVQSGLVELDPAHATPTLFRRLAGESAARIALDRDGAPIVITRGVDGGQPVQRIVRFGLEGLPETTWSSTPVVADHTEVAIGFDGLVFWTNGLISITRNGAVSRLLARSSPMLDTGSPILFQEHAFVVEHLNDGTDVLTRVQNGGDVDWRFTLPRGARRVSAAVDGAGRAYIVSSDGVLRVLDEGGAPVIETVLTAVPSPNAFEGSSIAIAPDGFAVIVGEGRVSAVETRTSLANSSWPRHRRDNLSTGQR